MVLECLGGMSAMRSFKYNTLYYWISHKGSNFKDWDPGAWYGGLDAVTDPWHMKQTRLGSFHHKKYG